MPGDRPILMMDSMVKAILDGRKTVTRRVGPTWAKVQPGTRLWVREAHAPADDLIGLTEDYVRDPPSSVVFRADMKAYICEGDRLIRADDSLISRPKRWHPSIHMPRWASRLTLDVVSVTEEVPSTWSAGSAPGAAWVTSMPSVDDAEARREGFASRAEFLAAWRSMHADYTGPVYRIEFRKLEAP